MIWSHAGLPELKNLPQTILLAAISKFAFLKMITGFVPLNSRVSGIKFFEANFIMDFQSQYSL